MYNKGKEKLIPVVSGFAVVDGTVGVTSVGDGFSVVSEYSA